MNCTDRVTLDTDKTDMSLPTMKHFTFNSANVSQSLSLSTIEEKLSTRLFSNLKNSINTARENIERDNKNMENTKNELNKYILCSIKDSILTISKTCKYNFYSPLDFEKYSEYCADMLNRMDPEVTKRYGTLSE